MAPQALNGETLLDRSQRILGVSLDQSEAEKTRTRKSNVSPGRRREQVAQAQRTHRQRTQRYIRELENEVIKLRNLHKSAEEQNRVVQTQVQILIASLASNHVSIPILPQVAIDPTTPDLDFSDLSESAASPIISVDISGLSTTTPESTCLIQASERSPVQLDLETIEQDHAGCAAPLSLGSYINKSSPQVSNGIVPARLDTQTGVDFVLRLERACFPHVKYALENDLDILSPNVSIHSGPGHVFTATCSLLRAAETPNPTSEPFNLHESDIDRLLDASRRLNLESEVTPVQVWERIKALGQAMPITPDMLQCMTEDFSKYTFCNSFGTVLDKSVAEVIFNYHFPMLTNVAAPI